MDLPSDDALRRIIRTYAGLRGAHGEGIGTPVLVQPTSQFFPDAFRGDAASVAQFLRAIIGYAPIADDLPMELALFDSAAAHGGGCGTGACGSAGDGSAVMKGVETVDGRYRVVLDVAHSSHPDALAASLARSVGSLVLHEASEDAGPARSELAAIACGFGVLLANGAALWVKGCGGLKMTRATALSVEEIAMGLAVFTALHGEKQAKARAHLGATQREAFDGACDWVDSNGRLIEWLRDSPSTLATSVIELEPIRGLFGHWLRKRKLEKPARVAPPAPLSDEKRRRLDQARQLVDEVLGSES